MFVYLGDGGIEFVPDQQSHDKTPNLKLVMNPEGKLHDWTDLPEEEVPELQQIAMGGNPELAHTVVENLQSCKGKGKQSPGQQHPSFAGSFRQVFDSRRGMFEQSNHGCSRLDTIRNNRHNHKREHTSSSNWNLPNIDTTKYQSQNYHTTPMPLARCKTLPNMAASRQPPNNNHFMNHNHHLQMAEPSRKSSPVSPKVPKRSSSKNVVTTKFNPNNNVGSQNINDIDMYRRPLRSFFCNP